MSWYRPRDSRGRFTSWGSSSSSRSSSGKGGNVSPAAALTVLGVVGAVLLGVPLLVFFLCCGGVMLTGATGGDRNAQARDDRKQPDPPPIADKGDVVPVVDRFDPPKDPPKKEPPKFRRPITFDLDALAPGQYGTFPPSAKGQPDHATVVAVLGPKSMLVRGRGRDFVLTGYVTTGYRPGNAVSLNGRWEVAGRREADGKQRWEFVRQPSE